MPEREVMGFRDFIAMFWPLLVVYVAAGVLVLAAFALSMMQRRREVRRMHEMRRDAGECLIEPSRPW